MFYYTPVNNTKNRGGRIILIPADGSLTCAQTLKWTISKFKLNSNDTVCLINIRTEIVDDIKLLNKLELNYNSKIANLHKECRQLSFRVLGVLAKELFKLKVNVIIASLCQLRDPTLPEVEWDLEKIIESSKAFAVMNEKFAGTLYEEAIRYPGSRITIVLPH